MKKLAIAFLFVLAPFLVVAVAETQCPMKAKKSCSMETSCLAKAQAGPYTVMLCAGKMKMEKEEKAEKKNKNEQHLVQLWIKNHLILHW